jgi:2-polyprenyl-3-methyl-5-hydroxy-6-metoxy-1,4-benzoquinol methylase
MAEIADPTPISPLTGTASQVTRIRDIALDQLKAGYADRFGIDISGLLGNIDRMSLFRDGATGLSFFHPMPFGDEAFYERLAQKVTGYYPVDKQEFGFSKAYVPAGATICEVGAGFGHFRAHVGEAQYTGLEFNQTAIDSARERGITLLRRDVRDLAAAAPDSFDVTCAFQVVEHVAEPLAFIAAMVELTRPGGKIILSTPNGDGYITRCRELLNAPPHHYTWWEDKTWAWVREKFGLAELKLHHTLIDEVAGAWAQMVAADGMAKLLGFELDPVVDETPLRRRIDVLAAPTAKIIVSGLKHRNDVPPIGHTTVAVFSR